MARKGDIFLDQASLKQVIRGLERVFPTHGKQNTAIANGMKKASKPLVTALQQAIDGATSQKRKAWCKKQSGFYFYFLEYGFVPFGKGNLRPGLGLLPKVVAEKGTYVNSRMLPYIWAEIKKGAKKNGIQVK